MAAAEDLCRGLVCSMLLFCVVASLWCIVNAIAVAIRDQAISIAVESFAAMGNQQPSGQRSVSGNDISDGKWAKSTCNGPPKPKPSPTKSQSYAEG